MDKDHSIYSTRHTVAVDLFLSSKEQGLTDLEAKHKLMPITRHKSLSGLENYLRDIGASLPKDYSKNYSINFNFYNCKKLVLLFNRLLLANIYRKSYCFFCKQVSFSAFLYI